MRRGSAAILGLLILFYGSIVQARNIWTKVGPLSGAKGIDANETRLYTANVNELKGALGISEVAATVHYMELPMPNGRMRNFIVRETPLMPASLAARYPQLRTFTAIATDDPTVTAKLDMTLYGFHAIVFEGGHTAFIDPYDNDNSILYKVHYKEDYIAATSFICAAKPGSAPTEEQARRLAAKTTAKVANGTQLRTYLLALSCDHDYAQAVTGLPSPSIAQVLSKMVTSMNRINGVYEREVAVTMSFVDNEDTLIWPTATGSINGPDPFNGINNNASACNLVNQTICDDRIGNANYALGHVFTTGAGGLSEIGNVCRAGTKAKSSTGRPNPVGDDFDIDFVAHEIGHEFGASHTFNNESDGSCAGDNRWQPTAYEPGSGSTLMAYAGICTPDNIQPHSDDYFHAASLLEIQDFISGFGNTCAVSTPTNNTPAALPAFTRSYDVPYLTPFELTAPDVTVPDTSVTYCWEQWDLSRAGLRLKDTRAEGPIFRSYPPVRSATRVFPNIDMVLEGVLSNAGIDTAEGEKAPDVSRVLTFKLTVRTMAGGNGTFAVPDDNIILNVANTGEGFKVTSQNTTGNIFTGGSPQRVTWNTAGTDQFPVNTANVDIYMSADGGYTWPYRVGRYLNNGTADVTLPNPDTAITNARLKVKGADNVFFNVNSENFSVVHSDVDDTDIKIRPVPVRNTLRISSGNKGAMQVAVFNAIGQEAWRGEVNGELDLPVTYWARGIYFMRFLDVKNQRTIKKFVVQ